MSLQKKRKINKSQGHLPQQGSDAGKARGMMRKGRRKRHGFTLIEMLLVVIIIGILAGGIITSLSGKSQDAKVARAHADISGSLSLALDLFDQDVGRYPSAEEGLKALVENPGGNASNWKGPYLKGGLKNDPWGNPYIYTLDAEHAGRYLLRSAGPDGQAGTEDDITE